MAVDAFIKFVGNKVKIKGESQDSALSGKDDWSALRSVTFSTEHQSSIGTSSLGAAGGKVKFNEFTITKYVDIASPALFLSLCSGDSLASAQIIMRKAVGGTASSGKTGYLSYDFALLFVTNIETALEEDAEAPTETVKFAYGASRITYAQQDITGSMGTAVSQEWSVISNGANMVVQTYKA